MNALTLTEVSRMARRTIASHVVHTMVEEGSSTSSTSSAGNACRYASTGSSIQQTSSTSCRACSFCAAFPVTFARTTSYVGKFWLLRSAGHGAYGAPDALLRLPRRALPSRNDLFHSKHRVRTLAALTVLNTRSQIPSRRPEHCLRGQRTASTAHVRERSFRLGSPPRRRGDRVRRD